MASRRGAYPAASQGSSGGNGWLKTSVRHGKVSILAL